MSLSLPSMNFAVVCNGNELETYDVKQEGPYSIRAWIASQAGKQFKITYHNKLVNFDLLVHLYIDGKRVKTKKASAGHGGGEIIGIRKSPISVLPFKFQELKLVDPDVENAPVVPGMGAIELRAFRCRRILRGAEINQTRANHRLHKGRVSERSKMAGWHHVGLADEVFRPSVIHAVIADPIDPSDAPCATFKIFYRPRELLMAQGVIVERDVLDAGTSGGPRVNNRKRARVDESHGPSNKRPGPSVKPEAEMSANYREQRIRVLQAEMDSLMAERSRSSVKCESRSLSPIVVGRAAGEVIDLTLED